MHDFLIIVNKYLTELRGNGKLYYTILIISDVKHIFVCLQIICISYSEKHLFRSVVIFK